MRFIALFSVVVTGALLLGSPTSAEAAGHKKEHGYHDNHYRRHSNYRYRYPRRHAYRHHSYYWGFGYPGYNVWHNHWPVGVHLDLRDRPRHRSERDHVVVTSADYQEPVETVATRSEVFVYPREGQSDEQRSQDRFECHLWARDQTGFDPSQASTNFNMAPDYNRAIAACLEGRGYTVK